MVKKVVVTKGKYRLTIGMKYRLHTNVDGIYVTTIRVNDGSVYVLDDVATMEIGYRQIEMDKVSSKLIYFVKGDDGSGIALQGEREDPLELEV